MIDSPAVTYCIPQADLDHANNMIFAFIVFTLTSIIALMLIVAHRRDRRLQRNDEVRLGPLMEIAMKELRDRRLSRNDDGRHVVVQTSWRDALIVVIIFTVAWFFGFMSSIHYWVAAWKLHVVMSLFSAVWFVFIIKWKHAIRWWHVVIIGVTCFVVYLFYLTILLVYVFGW